MHVLLLGGANIDYFLYRLTGNDNGPHYEIARSDGHASNDLSQI